MLLFAGPEPSSAGAASVMICGALTSRHGSHLLSLKLHFHRSQATTVFGASRVGVIELCHARPPDAFPEPFRVSEGESEPFGGIAKEVRRSRVRVLVRSSSYDRSGHCVSYLGRRVPGSLTRFAASSRERFEPRRPLTAGSPNRNADGYDPVRGER